MAILSKKISILFLAAILLCNGFAIIGFNNIKKPQAAYSELKEILGETVIICTDTNSSKFYISSFDRLDEEQKQHLRNLDSIKKNTHASDDHQNNDTEFYVTLNLKSISGKIFENDIFTESSFVQTQFSRAPPALS